MLDVLTQNPWFVSIVGGIIGSVVASAFLGFFKAIIVAISRTRPKHPIDANVLFSLFFIFYLGLAVPGFTIGAHVLSKYGRSVGLDEGGFILIALAVFFGASVGAAIWLFVQMFRHRQQHANGT